MFAAVAVIKTLTTINKGNINDNQSYSHRVKLFRNRLIFQVLHYWDERL